MTFLVLFIIIRILSNPIANVLQKQLTAVQHPFFVNLVSYAVLSMISLWLLVANPLPHLSYAFLMYALLGGICGALGNGFIIKALESGQLSILGPINAYKSIVGLFFAFILIGELPNAWGFLGIAFIIIGSYFVLENGDEQFTWSIFKQPAIQYRIAALLLTGIQAVLDKKVMLLSNLTIAFACWCIFGFLFSIPLFFSAGLNFKKQCSQITSNIAIKYIGLIIAVGVMVIATNYVFKNMQVGTALALFQISILLSVFFGYHIFKEKGLIKKLIGSLIMILGTLLIIFLK